MFGAGPISNVQKNAIFLKNLVDTSKAWSLYTAHNEGGAPLAATFCALVFFFESNTFRCLERLEAWHCKVPDGQPTTCVCASESVLVL